jgi:hypothetical protein
MMIALGSILVVVGSASALTPIGRFPVIRFWTSYRVVTMHVPARVWCPKQRPDCVWELYVNEPDIPAQTTVGIVSGRSGILTVPYPKSFCGVLQADAIVGPSPWLLEFGHQKMIKTGKRCDSPPTTTTTTTTTVPKSTTTTTKPHTTTTTTTTKPKSTTTTKPKSTTTTKPHTTTTKQSQLPFTSSTAPAAVAAASGSSTSSTKADAPTAQLPFTGADIKPLIIVGSVLILLGLYILTTLEQRRRAVRRMAYSLRSGSAAGFATRTSRWFLGE